jgi:thiamine-phosphate pyrophosphorylase
MPSLVLLTDDERLPDPCAAARCLPPGSLIVLRARDNARRAELANALLKIAQAQSLKLLIAADPQLAARVGAHGVHFPEAMSAEASHWRVRRPQWLITCAAHSMAACMKAGLVGADAALLAPVFATGSHLGRKPLGLFRAAAIARFAPLPVLALGGIGSQTASRLPAMSFDGVAAIEALSASR